MNKGNLSGGHVVEVEVNPRPGGLLAVMEWLVGKHVGGGSRVPCAYPDLVVFIVIICSQP